MEHKRNVRGVMLKLIHCINWSTVLFLLAIVGYSTQYDRTIAIGMIMLSVCLHRSAVCHSVSLTDWNAKN